MADSAPVKRILIREVPGPGSRITAPRGTSGNLGTRIGPSEVLGSPTSCPGLSGRNMMAGIVAPTTTAPCSPQSVADAILAVWEPDPVAACRLPLLDRDRSWPRCAPEPGGPDVQLLDSHAARSFRTDDDTPQHSTIRRGPQTVSTIEAQCIDRKEGRAEPEAHPATGVAAPAVVCSGMVRPVYELGKRRGRRT